MTDAAQRFTLLYDQHHPRVLAYARSRASREVAEEVASATFLVAWERLDRLSEPALPWLLAVARNLIRKHYAQAGRQQATVAVLAALATGEASEGDVAEVVVERAAMLRALASLPALDQEALTLVAWHGLTAGEAARSSAAPGRRSSSACTGPGAAWRPLLPRPPSPRLPRRRRPSRAQPGQPGPCRCSDQQGSVE